MRVPDPLKFRIAVLLLVGAAWTLSLPGLVAAGDAPPGPAEQARQLADEVLAEPAAEVLDAWSKAVIDRALQRASRVAVPRGLPRYGGAFESKGSATGEVLLFTSLAVPAPSWRASAREAARIGVPLVLRGVVETSLPETARRITSRLGDAKAAVAIDPRLFRLFGIERVPAVVVVPGGVPLCRSHGCAEDLPPPFDRVSGNLSLAAALEAVAAEGGTGRSAARRYLATLRGTTP